MWCNLKQKWAAENDLLPPDHQNYSEVAITSFDNNIHISFMDALVAVAGFKTRQQVDILYDVFKHLSLKHQDEPHLANSD